MSQLFSGTDYAVFMLGALKVVQPMALAATGVYFRREGIRVWISEGNGTPCSCGG